MSQSHMKLTKPNSIYGTRNFIFFFRKKIPVYYQIHLNNTGLGFSVNSSIIPHPHLSHYHTHGRGLVLNVWRNNSPLYSKQLFFLYFPLLPSRMVESCPFN